MEDRRVGLVNVPLTYPPYPVNGFMVSGLLTPSTNVQFTYPPELGDWLRAEGYRIFVNWADYWGRPDQFIKDIYITTEKRVRLIRQLIQNEQWDFFMFVISGTDTIQHYFWRHPDYPKHGQFTSIIQDYFAFVDDQLATILRQVSDDTYIIVMSDHGFGLTPTHMVHLNNWLEQEGYLKRNHRSKAKSTLWRYLFTIGNMPGIYRLKRRLAKVHKRIEGRLNVNIDDIDWGQTYAYFMHSWVNTGFIRLNVQGRDPKAVSYTHLTLPTTERV